MGEKVAPENTGKMSKADTKIFLLEGMIMGSDAILLQESQGQASFVKSTTLPIEMSPEAKKTLEKAGVKFGEVVENDDLFCYVEFPKGWKKIPTDHSMGSKLVDEKGRKRASIFYKAACYDRKASLSITRRFGFWQDYKKRDQGIAVAQVTDCEQVIHETEPIKIGDKRVCEAGKQAEEIALKWLNENYPQWRDAGAYWD